MLRLACVQDKHCRREIVERTKRRIEPSDRYAQIIATITAAATLQAPAVAATRWRWDLMAGSAQLPATRAASSGRESLLRALQIIIVLLLNICSIAAVVDAAAGDEGRRRRFERRKRRLKEAPPPEACDVFGRRV